jgi:hypothetical protein
MKFVCLGYAEQGKWEAMTEKERQAKMEECLAYDDVLQKEGVDLDGIQWVIGTIPQSSSRITPTMSFRLSVGRHVVGSAVIRSLAFMEILLSPRSPSMQEAFRKRGRIYFLKRRSKAARASSGVAVEARESVRSNDFAGE